MSEVKTYTLALVGNPNVGKSTVFNALTGMRQHTGNWPGKTVSSARGRCSGGGKSFVLVDTPGCYSLQAHSQEEAITRDFLLSGEADGVIVVCDATCLGRSLHLVLEVLQLTRRVVVCVNLLDEAARRSIRLDIPALTAALGVPVVGCAARRKRGMDALLHAAAAAVEAPDAPAPSAWPDREALVREAARLAGLCTAATPGGDETDRRLDRLLTGRFTGFAAMFLLLSLLFYITLEGANYPSALLSKWLFRLQDGMLAAWGRAAWPPWLGEMLILGVYRTVAWVMAVMLPPMAIFFPLFTLLEDLGYLPRVAFNLDRGFQRCRACGKQALCMCMGFGCNAVGVVGCRIIDSPRERLIAMLTNSFVPCNGRFPTLIAMIAMFFTGDAAAGPLSALLLSAFVLLGIGMTLLVSRVLSATVLKGVPSSFTLELPPYRPPQVAPVLLRSLSERTLLILSRALRVAAPAGLVLWVLGNVEAGGVSLLLHAANALEPVGRFFGLDGVILLAFLLGLPANEIVLPVLLMTYTAQGSLTAYAGYAQLRAVLVANGWTWVTAVCFMLFCLMHWPGSTTLLTIRRESGSGKWMLLAALLPTACGLLCCGLFAAAARLLGWG